jgi:steroid 5-alpha reductase family enzyme
VIALLYFTVAWLVSLQRKDAGVVDTFWGPGFLVLAIFYALFGEGFPGRKVLVVLLVALWALRLAMHIFTRNRGKGEDYRYREMRAKGGEKFWWQSLFKVFFLQAVLLWVISAPLLMAQRTSQPDHFTGWDIVGTLIWALGIFWEAVGDWQLRQFKADPANKGKVMRSGLWAFTRHPNYFGETLVWWGMFIIALGTPFGFLSVVGPVVITFMLLRVSGVAMLEKGLKETKPEYQDYAARTSAFIPWFPKK